MREVLYTCDICGQNLGITEDETTKNIKMNCLVDGIGYIQAKIHEGDHIPMKVQLHVNLCNSNGNKMRRDICSDCLMQGQDYLVIGMPERTEDEKV